MTSRTYEGIELIPDASVFPVVPGHEVVGRVVKLAPDANLGVDEGDRVGVDEILSGQPPFRVYGYCDMTGEGRVGLWGGYGEYMEILPGTGLHRMTESLPAEQLTLFEPLANGVNWVSIGGVHEGDTVVIEGPGHQGLAVLEAVLARRPEARDRHRDLRRRHPARDRSRDRRHPHGRGRRRQPP